MTDKVLRKYADEFGKKKNQFYYEHQVSGSSSKLRSYYRYSDLLDICNLAQQGLESRNDARERIRNSLRESIAALKKQLVAESFSKNEVESILDKIAFML